MKKIFYGLLPDVLMTVGTGLISYGVWLILPAAGYIVLGVALLVSGVMAASA